MPNSLNLSNHKDFAIKRFTPSNSRASRLKLINNHQGFEGTGTQKRNDYQSDYDFSLINNQTNQGKKSKELLARMRGSLKD